MRIYNANWRETFHHVPFKLFQNRRVLRQDHRQCIRIAILFRFGGSCLRSIEKVVGLLLVANIQSILLLPSNSYALYLPAKPAQPSSLSFFFFESPNSNTSLDVTRR